MTECRGYELEISALLDGESDPATALDLVEHVGGCRRCADFVREARAAQAQIDGAYGSTEETAVIRALPARRQRPAPPRWAWAVAATIVVAVGGYFAMAPDPRGTGGGSDAVEIVVRLEEDPGAMTDDRFIEMTTQLLRADRIYRDQMYAVLEAVRAGGPPSESGTLDEASPNGGDVRAGDAAATPLYALD